MARPIIIDAPGLYIDRRGRQVTVRGRASHNRERWMGIAYDDCDCCWEATGIMEGSLPSDIEIVRKVEAEAGQSTTLDRTT